MIYLRFAVLPILLTLGLCGIYLLPQSGQIAQSAVIMDLPQGYGSWQFRKVPPTEDEIGTLSADTEFSKAVCVRPVFGAFSQTGQPVYDRISLSIVLSGTDINNSIHRPERCMPAQGHQITSSEERLLKAGDREIKVTYLKSFQRLPLNKQRTEFLTLPSVTYYFFVGHDRVTNSHMERTLIDMKDRLLKGRDQRWAYIQVSTTYGDRPGVSNYEATEEDAVVMLENFLKPFIKAQINWDQLTN